MATFGWISANKFKVPNLETDALTYKDDNNVQQDVKGQFNKLENAAGLNADGTYSQHVDSNYINGAADLKAADKELDSQIKKTRDGAGFDGADGSLGDWHGIAGTSLAGTSNLKDGVEALDTALSTETKRAGDKETDLQNELDATQIGAGLKEDGTFGGWEDDSKNYLENDNNTLKKGIEKLDRKMHSVIKGTGTYSADATTNYISGATNLKDADKKLDAQVKVNADNISSNDTELNNLRQYTGTDENAIQWSSTNYLDNTAVTGDITLKKGIEKLDVKVQSNESRIGNEETARANAVSSLESLVQARSAGLDPKESVAVSSSDTIATGKNWNVGLRNNTGLGSGPNTNSYPPLKEDAAQNSRKYVEMPQPDDANGNAVDPIRIYEAKAGQALPNATRVLLRHQTDAKENGIYVLAECKDVNQNSYWCLQRSKDFNGQSESDGDYSSDKDITPGAFTFVESGEHKNQGFVVQSAAFTAASKDHASPVAGTTYEKVDVDIVFVKFSGVDARDIDGVSLEYNANNVVAIKADGVTEVHLNSKKDHEAVVTEVIRNSAVTTDKINDGAVTTAKIAALNITTGLIADGAVTALQLASNSVTTQKIADDTIVASQIKTDAVENDKIKDDAVTHQKIDLDGAKMKLTAEGLGFTGDQSTGLGDLANGEMKLVKRTIPAGQPFAGTYLSVVHKDAAGNALYYTNLAPIQA